MQFTSSGYFNSWVASATNSGTAPDFDFSGLANGDILVFNSATQEVEPFSQSPVSLQEAVQANLGIVTTPVFNSTLITYLP